MYTQKTDHALIWCYTTALNIDPEDAEDIFLQKRYNMLFLNNIPYEHEPNVKAYSFIGMISGFKTVFNILVYRYT